MKWDAAVQRYSAVRIILVPLDLGNSSSFNFELMSILNILKINIRLFLWYTYFTL